MYSIIVRADQDAPFARVVDAVRAAQTRGQFFAFGVVPYPRSKLRLLEWDCPFPPEADTAQVDEATVIVRARTDASGRAVGVTVVKDPGHGFGEAALACAMRAEYEPAYDERGQPAEGMAVFRVHFSRPPPDEEKH